MVLARSAAPFSASITDFLWPVYHFDGMCLVLCHQHDEHMYNACLERFLHVGATYCLFDGG
jgi:hypothetical protein